MSIARLRIAYLLDVVMGPLDNALYDAQHFIFDAATADSLGVVAEFAPDWQEAWTS